MFILKNDIYMENECFIRSIENDGLLSYIIKNLSKHDMLSSHSQHYQLS